MTQPTPASTSDGIQSVETGMAVLATLARCPRPTALSELARLCDMPRSKLHKYLASLERSGFVEREPASGHYRLGRASVQLGLRALRGLDVAQVAGEALAELAEHLGHPVFLSVWGDFGPVILRWEEAGPSVTVNVRVGSTMPLLRSATGHIFATWLPTARLLPLLAPLPEDDARQQLDTIATRVRTTGLAPLHGELLPGIDALAAPLFNRDAQLVGALTTLGLSGHLSVALDDTPAQILRQSAARISERLGLLSDGGDVG